MQYPSLEGKVAIVTGASRGIGRAVALRLAAEGCRLVLSHLRDREAMEATRAACTAAGADVVGLTGDVADPDIATVLVDSAMNRHGRVDVLVNNAGATREDPLALLTTEDVERMLAVNAAGPVWMTRAVMRPMLRQRSGAVVSLSSALARGAGRGNAVYAGTKGFVESFTRAMAAELGGKGIRVNAVAPGTIDTDMTLPVRQLAGERLSERIGLRRIGTPEEVAAAVAFLASDEAAYVTGAVLAVDGGFLGGVWEDRR